MDRVQLFEFEDFDWFPESIRSHMTKLLSRLNQLMGLDFAIADTISEIHNNYPITDIVDLGSGSGGVMPDVVKLLQEQQKLDAKLTLTDLHPSQATITKFQNNTDSVIYYQESVDARNFETIPAGLKTMVNMFHHIPPADAKQILQSATDNGQAMLIYEMRENNIPLIIWFLFLPLGLLITFIMALVLTLLSRPITLDQLFFTFIIPIIPLSFAWDGQASLPRMYSFKDLKSMTEDFNSDAYTWSLGYGKNLKGKKLGTYLLGMPS
jgi:hypothetical protein